MHPIKKIPAIHPFPARMAPELLFEWLPKPNKGPLRILDPMVGSGTSVVASRLFGHNAFGCDSDPLAVLQARVWTSDINTTRVRSLATAIQEKAKDNYCKTSNISVYPSKIDEETKAFIDYWFDARNRRELTALAESISSLKERGSREVMWCAFSRLIIAKSNGASLANDLAHSRPHKVPGKSPLRPIDAFAKSVDTIVDKLPFAKNYSHLPPAIVRLGDARRLRFPDSFFDIVITSPPYLNAIDYIRVSKFSLVWMGYSIKHLSSIRSSNIGAERGPEFTQYKERLEALLYKSCEFDRFQKRMKGVLLRYAHDISMVFGELARVSKLNSRCLIVVGDNLVTGLPIHNSRLICEVAESFGYDDITLSRRDLEPNKRYLPAPKSKKRPEGITNRLRQEVVIDMTLKKKRLSKT